MNAAVNSGDTAWMLVSCARACLLPSSSKTTPTRTT